MTTNERGPVLHAWQAGGFALYVHWPFCQSKCPYCDFNSHVAATIDQDAWLSAYLTELRRLSRETSGRVLGSLYFGGGTPSLMEASVVGEIIAEAVKLWTPANDIEITLEANPTSIEVGRFTGYRAAGVNRVSIGVQALNDQDLRKLGRMHDAREAVSAIEIAQRLFERTSFDLIYARQDQSADEWLAELRMALSIAGNHLSLYQLTIEPETVFGARHERGLLAGLPDETLAADLYELTQDECEAAGLPAYEVSNHASEGAMSRHNLVYWRGGDYIGIGPGAHGRLTDSAGVRRATVSTKDPSRWLSSVQKTGSGEEPREALSRKDHGYESLLMGLRLNEGIDVQAFAQLSGVELDKDSIQSLCDLGLLSLTGSRLRTTRHGRMLLNSVLQQIAP